MSDHVMTIGGEAVDGERSFGVVNPATAEVFAWAPDCSREQFELAAESAQRAQIGWGGLDQTDRTAAMLRAADALDAAAPDLGRTLTEEQGKPLPIAVAEAHSVAAWLRYFADLEMPREVLQDDARAMVELRRRPIGVIAAITPWNSPLSMAAWKIAPALRAGNSIVVKPSPFTPLATLQMGVILNEALPPGVVNVVSGGDELGSWLSSHPRIGKVSFTGSVGTGKKVAVSAGSELKRVGLELGGNDPAIVLDDADPGQVAEKLFWSAFRNSGQVCVAVKRVYVAERLHDDLVDALASLALSVKVDDGMLPGTDLGPINNEPQLVRVTGLVSDALDYGGKAVTGGSRIDRRGYFYYPTILTGVDDGTRIVDEEQFGPVLPVISYNDEDDVISRANAGHFGLGGSVWSSDDDRAASIAERLHTGTAWVNTHAALGLQQPFGGVKWSGIGVENGILGLHGYTDVQVLYKART